MLHLSNDLNYPSAEYLVIPNTNLCFKLCLSEFNLLNKTISTLSFILPPELDE